MGTRRLTPSLAVVSMSVFSGRENRVLAAVGLGILLATIAASLSQNQPDSAIVRGDFPAFYTMAVVVKEGLGERLYELALQQEVQARYWKSLSASLLPAAYPPYLAALLLPLAYLEPAAARATWIIANALATLCAVVIMSQALPTLRPYRWQMCVLSLSFFPLLAGVIGGQSVGLSLILLAAIVALSKSPSKTRQIELGILTGLWMFKPHYALAAVWLLLVQRRGNALLAWAFTSLVLWLLGATVSGISWFDHWLVFARQFSHIDIVTNSDQMTGVVPFLYSATKRLALGEILGQDLLFQSTVVVAAFVPISLFFINREAMRRAAPDTSLPYLMIAPILLICAPAANFYDLSLLLIPVSSVISPSETRDRRILIAILILSACGVLLRECDVYGSSFALSVILGTFVSVRLFRGRARRVGTV